MFLIWILNYVLFWGCFLGWDFIEVLIVVVVIVIICGVFFVFIVCFLGDGFVGCGSFVFLYVFFFICVLIWDLKFKNFKKFIFEFFCYFYLFNIFFFCIFLSF